MLTNDLEANYHAHRKSEYYIKRKMYANFSVSTIKDFNLEETITLLWTCCNMKIIILLISASSDVK